MKKRNTNVNAKIQNSITVTVSVKMDAFSKLKNMQERINRSPEENVKLSLDLLPFSVSLEL